jgi:FAD/FMN-containing dehydrogenase
MTDQLLTPADELAGGFRGELVQPGDEGYDEARAVWNGLFDRRPALVARCAGVADVIAAVRYARETTTPVAVRGGGHSAAGHSTCDDGLVIDLSRMRSVRVDPEARTARAEAGATWADFDAETQAFGLAVTGGRFSTTGIAGLTLGSGSGWLERKCGLTPDNLISADVAAVAATSGSSRRSSTGCTRSGRSSTAASSAARLSAPATSCGSCASTCRERRKTSAAGWRS